MFKVKMEDGSIFEMSEGWGKALEMKYPRKEWDRVALAFQLETAKHWKDRTVPTKFGDESWGSNYKMDLWYKAWDKTIQNEYKEVEQVLNKKFGKLFGMKVEGISCTCPKGTAFNHTKRGLGGEKMIKKVSRGIYLVKQEETNKIYIIHEHGDMIDKEYYKVDKKWDKIRDRMIEKEVKNAIKHGKIGYKNQAELGHDVMYSVLRVPLMSLVMAEMQKGEKNKTKIIGLDDEGGATVYEGKKVKKIKDVAKYLA